MFKLSSMSLSLTKPKRILNYTNSFPFTSCYSEFLLISISISSLSHTFGQTTKKPIFPELCGWISILKGCVNDFKGPQIHSKDVLRAWHQFHQVTKGVFGSSIFITHISISITHNSKIVRPMTQKVVWLSITLFPSLYFLIFELWVMETKNTF